jgi:hypothetical protein
MAGMMSLAHAERRDAYRERIESANRRGCGVQEELEPTLGLSLRIKCRCGNETIKIHFAAFPTLLKLDTLGSLTPRSNPPSMIIHQTCGYLSPGAGP